MHAYAHASFAANSENSRSTSSLMSSLGVGPISSGAKTQDKGLRNQQWRRR